MMKYLLVLVVVVVAAWVMMGRSRGRGNADRTAGSKRNDSAAADAAGASGAVQPMVACSHCGLHLPRADAVADAQGRLFCDSAHRLAGPR